MSGRRRAQRRRDGAPAGIVLASGLLLAISATTAGSSDLDNWHAVRTAHFEVLTDAPPDRGAEIGLELERFRAVFARMAPGLELKSPGPTTILAFEDQNAFAPYRSRQRKDAVPTLGEFLQNPDGNYLTLNASPAVVGALSVAYHEYTHYLVRHNFPRAPLWFNEGLAEYYSTFAADDETVVLGRPVRRHLLWLQAQDGFSLGDLLCATTRSASYHDRREVEGLYALSWAVVHHLLSGSEERLDQTAELLYLLHLDEDPLEAFELSFDMRISAFEEELEARVREGVFLPAAISLSSLPVPMEAEITQLRPAEALYHLGDLLLHQNRTEEAEEHFLRALELESQHPDLLAALARVRDQQGRHEEAEVLFSQAAELAPRQPLSYLWHARHLLMGLQDRVWDNDSPLAGDLARRARESLKKALLLHPDFAEVLALLGRTYLFTPQDRSEGFSILRRAQLLLPFRGDVVYHLVLLHLYEQQFSEAERLIEGELLQRGPQELVERARSEAQRLKLVAEARGAFSRGDSEAGLRLYDEAISAAEDPEMRAAMEERLRALKRRWRGE